TTADRLATSCADGRARVFPVPAGEGESRPLFAPVPHSGGFFGVTHGGPDSVAPRFVNRGRELLTVTGGSDAVWRDVRTGDPLRTVAAPPDFHRLTAIAVSPGGRYLALVWV